MPSYSPDKKCLLLLISAPLVRRNGRWRCGPAWIGDSVVDRLAAAGRVIKTDDRVTLAPEAA